MATRLGLSQQIIQTGNEIYRTETDEEHLKAHEASVRSINPSIDEEELPELITNRVLEIISQGVEPLIQQKKGREYIPNIQNIYQGKLFLFLQEKLGLHPYQ